MIQEDLRIQLYTTMKRVRNFEMCSIDMYIKGEMPGFLHPCVGQEAGIAGTGATLAAGDLMLTNHRGHGHLIAKGVNLDEMMAELFAKETGCCKGRGGSMHIMSPKHGIIGANGIVGAGISIATGAGLAAKMNNTGQVVMVFFGDGAANTGSFHEGVNLAAIWDLPVVFVCENNLYAESTLQSYATRVENLSERATGYGIPGLTVDGNDVEQVYEACLTMVERARTGQGPSFLEYRTYKWFGHYIGDQALYRTDEEVNFWKTQDPIPRYEAALLKEKVLTVKHIKEIDQTLSEELEHAVTFAKESPGPDPAEALKYIYAA